MAVITSDGKIHALNQGVAVITINHTNHTSKCVVYVTDGDNTKGKDKGNGKGKAKGHFK